jgi:hypothetical protein
MRKFKGNFRERRKSRVLQVKLVGTSEFFVG